MRLLRSGQPPASRAAAFAALLLTASACSSDNPFEPSRLLPSGPSNAVGTNVAKVTLVPDSGVEKASFKVIVGRKAYFSAVAYDKSGSVISFSTKLRPVFKSSAPAVFPADSLTGDAKPLTAGTFTLTVTVGTVSTSAAYTSVSPTTTTTTPTTTTPKPVTRLTVAAVSGSMDVTTWTLAPGSTEQFKATAYDSTGVVVSSASPKYRSTNAAVLKVDSLTGAATAVAAGTAAITATVNSITGTSSTVNVASVVAAAKPAPTPVPTGSVALTVVRFDGQSGAATVSNGIPLAPGALFPGQESAVHVFVGGVEQPVYVTGLSSLHTDGSLRAALVQFKMQSLSTPVQGVLSIGTTRSTAMTLSSPLATPGTLVAGTPAGLPQAAALPTDPNYLLATDLVGGTISSATATALSGVYARYESNFVNYGALLWSSEGANWAGDYYDRALIYYAFWARTGNPTYWQRAGQIAYDYRTKYVEANSYVISPHWTQLEGLEKHYLLTGDDMSRFAVARVANLLNGYTPSNYMTRGSGDSRIAARVLHSQLLAWRLTPPGQTLAGNSAATYGAHLEAALGKIVAWQQPDGSYPADGVVCGGQLNYMVGLLNDALIKTYDYYLPATSSRASLQATEQTLVQKAVDYMWNTQWLPTSRAFQYATVTCTGVGGPTAAPDLNNLIATGFGWLYKRTGNAQYLTNGDAIFAGGVAQAWLNGSKQFNENYTASFRYLGYR